MEEEESTERSVKVQLVSVTAVKMLLVYDATMMNGAEREITVVQCERVNGITAETEERDETVMFNALNMPPLT